MKNETSPIDKDLAWFFDEVNGFFKYLEHFAEKYGDEMNQSKVLNVMYESSEFYEKNHHRYKTPKQVAFQFMKKTFKGSKDMMKIYNRYSNAKAEIEEQKA